jgi:hypothetical protein
MQNSNSLEEVNFSFLIKLFISKIKFISTLSIIFIIVGYLYYESSNQTEIRANGMIEIGYYNDRFQNIPIEQSDSLYKYLNWTYYDAPLYKAKYFNQANLEIINKLDIKASSEGKLLAEIQVRGASEKNLINYFNSILNNVIDRHLKIRDNQILSTQLQLDKVSKDINRFKNLKGSNNSIASKIFPLEDKKNTLLKKLEYMENAYIPSKGYGSVQITENDSHNLYINLVMFFLLGSFISIFIVILNYYIKIFKTN